MCEQALDGEEDGLDAQDGAPFLRELLHLVGGVLHGLVQDGDAGLASIGGGAVCGITLFVDVGVLWDEKNEKST